MYVNMNKNTYRLISITMHKMQVQSIKDININPTTLNFKEKKFGRSLGHMDIGDHFLNIPPVAYTLRTTVNKWDLLKLRSFLKQRTQSNGSQLNGKRSSPTPHWTDLQNIERTKEIRHQNIK